MEIIEKERHQDLSASLKEQVDEYQKLKQSKRDKLKELQQDQMRATHKIKDKIESKAKLDRSRDHNLNEVKRIDSRIQKLNTDIGEVSNKLVQLERENPWIVSERQKFGLEDSEYAFSKAFNIKDLSVQYYRLKEDTEKLRLQVNMKVDQMAE
jgi:chromosome segregation ATPase